MKNKRPTIYLIFFFFTSLLAIGACSKLFLIIKSKNEQNKEKILMLEINNLKKQNAQELASKANEMTDALKTVNSYFIDSSAVDLLADYLENLGTITNTEVKVDGVNSTLSKSSLDVKMNTEGEFSNIVKLLTLLENAPYKIEITQTSFNKITQASIPDSKNPTKFIPSLWRLDVHFTILISTI